MTLTSTAGRLERLLMSYFLSLQIGLRSGSRSLSFFR